MIFSQRKKPAPSLAGSKATTTLRVCPETLEALDRVRSEIMEWLLSHPDPITRKKALRLGLDQTLRIILATFARDYGVPAMGGSS